MSFAFEIERFRATVGHIPDRTRSYLARVMTTPSARRRHEDLVNCVDCLSIISFFSDLNPSQRVAVFREVVYERCQAGDVIFQEGEVGRTFYVVVHGAVSINVRDPSDPSRMTFVRQLFPGQHFGEMALQYGEGLRSATVRCDEDSELLKIDKASYDRAIQNWRQQRNQEKADFVAHAPLFHRWPPQELAAVGNCMLTRHYEPNTPIVRQGQPADGIFWIMSGECRALKAVRVGEQALMLEIGQLKHHHVFGADEQLLQALRSARDGTTAGSSAEPPTPVLAPGDAGPAALPAAIAEDEEQLAAEEASVTAEARVGVNPCSVVSVGRCDVLFMSRHEFCAKVLFRPETEEGHFLLSGVPFFSTPQELVDELIKSAEAQEAKSALVREALSATAMAAERPVAPRKPPRRRSMLPGVIRELRAERRRRPSSKDAHQQQHLRVTDGLQQQGGSRSSVTRQRSTKRSDKKTFRRVSLFQLPIRLPGQK